DQHIEEAERRGDDQYESGEDHYCLSEAAKYVRSPITPGTSLPRPSVLEGLGDAVSLGEPATLGNRTKVLVLPPLSFRRGTANPRFWGPALVLTKAATPVLRSALV